MSEKPRAGEKCDCWQHHHDECQHFDFERGYLNLKGDIKALEKLIDDGFTIELEPFGDGSAGSYMIRAKHPSQIEEAEAHSILSGICELADWVHECAVME